MLHNMIRSYLGQIPVLLLGMSIEYAFSSEVGKLKLEISKLISLLIIFLIAIILLLTKLIKVNSNVIVQVSHELHVV